MVIGSPIERDKDVSIIRKVEETIVWQDFDQVNVDSELKKN